MQPLVPISLPSPPPERFSAPLMRSATSAFGESPAWLADSQPPASANDVEPSSR